MNTNGSTKRTTSTHTHRLRRLAVASACVAGALGVLTIAAAAASATPTTPDHTVTVSPTQLSVPHPTILTITGHGCVPAPAGQSTITITADSTPAPAPDHAVPDMNGDWTAHLTIPYAIAVHSVTLTITCAGAAAFSYPPTLLDYQPYAIGDGFMGHTVTLAPATVAPHDRVRVRSLDWRPHQVAQVSLDSLSPFTTATADAHGVIDSVVTLPARVTVGRHALWLRGGHSIVTETSEIDIADAGNAFVTVAVASTQQPPDLPTEPLARTGSRTAPALGTAAVLLCGGALTLAAGRRRD